MHDFGTEHDCLDDKHESRENILRKSKIKITRN